MNLALARGLLDEFGWSASVGVALFVGLRRAGRVAAGTWRAGLLSKAHCPPCGMLIARAHIALSAGPSPNQLSPQEDLGLRLISSLESGCSFRGVSYQSCASRMLRTAKRMPRSVALGVKLRYGFFASSRPPEGSRTRRGNVGAQNIHSGNGGQTSQRDRSMGA